MQVAYRNLRTLSERFAVKNSLRKRNRSKVSASDLHAWDEGSVWVIVDISTFRRVNDDYSTPFPSGRASPNFFIRESNVVRFRPSRAAAPFGPPTTHLHSSSVR